MLSKLLFFSGFIVSTIITYYIFPSLHFKLYDEITLKYINDIQVFIFAMLSIYCIILMFAIYIKLLIKAYKGDVSTKSIQ